MRCVKKRVSMFTIKQFTNWRNINVSQQIKTTVLHNTEGKGMF